MTGPYDWVAPLYWFAADTLGGARGFNTETSPGPAVPPIESLRMMLPSDHLWPIDSVWNFHAGGGQFTRMTRFIEALTARYGAPSGVEDFAMKSQVMAYEGERAMFEAYARNKYVSTGVIQWMLNNGWPGLIWHLYDYYLRPGGSYFGAKKGCEPLHIQYSYDDRSVVVTNARYETVGGLKARAKVYGFDMAEKFSKEAALEAGPDSSNRIFTIPEIAGLAGTYFVRLALEDSAGKMVSSNFYWLSTKPETLDWEKSTWYHTPTKTFADFTALGRLPKVKVRLDSRLERRGEEGVARVTVENPTHSLAFFTHLKVTKGKGGEEVLPILWEDNYFPLLPGEKREITGSYRHKDLGEAEAVVAVDGWNVE